MTDTTQQTTEEQTQEQTPSQEPSQESATPEATPDGFETEIAELLKDEFDDTQLPASEEAPAEAEAGAETPSEEAPQEEEPPAEETQQEQQQEASASEQPTTQEETAQTPDVGNFEASAEELQQALEQYQAQAQEQLATHVYSLSQEEVQAIDEDPAEFLKTKGPQLFARVHLQAQLAAMAQMSRLLPTVMRQVQETQAQASSFESKFFERWPQLKDHYDQVMKIGQVYRQVNPQAKPEDFIETVGLQAALQLKLPVQGQQKPVQQQRQQPFEPVAARAGVAPTPQSNQPPNEFEQLAVEEMQEMGIPVKE